MCINIWQKFHLLHLFSIGLMHEASVLKAFEWKLQKRAEREKGCRRGWAAGRAAGKPEDGSLARDGVSGREAEGRPTQRWDQGTACSFTPHPPGQAPLPPPFPSLLFLSFHPKSKWVPGERWPELGTGEVAKAGSFLPARLLAGAR